MSYITPKEKDLITLIKRSNDIGDGWRIISNICWPFALQLKDSKLFEFDHHRKRIRIKPKRPPMTAPPPKPKAEQLFEQIAEWRTEKLKELEMHERQETAKSTARSLFVP